jgi:elongation factor G
MVEILGDVDDHILEKFLNDEDPTSEEIRTALRKGTILLKVCPVLCGAAFKNKGVQPLMEAVVDYLPSPLDVPPIEGVHPKSSEVMKRPASDDAPFSALAFKIASDPFVGQLTYIRVYSGHMETGKQVFNPRLDRTSRIGRLLKMHANKREEISEVWAGDIAAAVGLGGITTGDTLCERSRPILLETMAFPTPVIAVAIEPRTKADQEKLALTLDKMTKEDPTFRVHVDPETGQTIISGMGELHLEIITDRLLRDFKVQAKVGRPQVAYRETIMGLGGAEGRYIRQAGGRGHYGHVKLQVEPLAPGGGFEFVSEVKGGRVPKEFIPAVEAGAREATQGGILAGYEVVDVKVTLLDGSWHEVDSSEIAFKIAASMAFKEAAEEAGLVLLEPIMKVEVVVPEEYLGEVIGDLNSRRGKVEHLDARGSSQIVAARVPLAEMFGYATDLRSLTQGRADHTMHFLRYEEAPREVSDGIVARIEGRTFA